MRAVQSIAAYTAEHGGGTFEAGTLLPFEPRAGYAVGMAEGTYAHGTDAASLDRLVRAVAGEWQASYVGTWIAPDGRVCVDPVEYVADRERAVRLGRERGQQAVYSFADGVAIETGGQNG